MRFSEVVGQDKIKKHLVKEVKQNRVSHAQMFFGPEGSNKLPLAIAFSQFLLCESPSENDSCGECASCKQVNSYSHPDLHFSYPSLQADRKKGDKGASLDKAWIEQLKENPEFSYEQWNQSVSSTNKVTILGNYESQLIPKQLSLKSFSGGYKVMIIWMSEKMNSTCANKLLKLLEEPPKKTVLILISESTETTLPTIISRVQIIDFSKLNDSEVKQVLVEKGASDEQVADILPQANGNIIEALDLLAGGEKKKLFLKKFITLMRACYTKDVGIMLDWSDNAASSLGRKDTIDFLNYSLYMTRQSLLSNYKKELSKGTAEEVQFMTKFAKFINGNNVYKIYEGFNEAIYNIQRNCNSKIILTGLTFQLMRELHKA